MNKLDICNNGIEALESIANLENMSFSWPEVINNMDGEVTSIDKKDYDKAEYVTIYLTKEQIEKVIDFYQTLKNQCEFGD